jgi:ABC-2 type transport system ATP-binding protein
MSLLEVKNVSRFYGALRAVENVSFNLEAGSILGFIGPNGAGKSTTLDVPTSGEVLLDGRSVVVRPDQARPLLGYMPDRYGTYDDMTVFEFLDFFARAYQLKGAQRVERVDAVMDFAGLFPLKDKLTSALSKGMKQRVALGRTLLHDPKLLILDEPADGLDPRARIELRELLRALAAQGKAVLISSHILTELAEICDTCAIIEQGKLLAQGSVAELMSGTKSSEQVFAAAMFEVRLFANPDELPALLLAAERILLEQPAVKRVEQLPDGLRVALEHSNPTPTWVDEASVRVIAALVAQKIPLAGFENRKANLEDVFLSVTKGRVQ